MRGIAGRVRGARRRVGGSVALVVVMIVASSCGIDSGSSGSWTQRNSLTIAGGFSAIACPTATTCVALVGSVESVQFNGTRWTGPILAEHVTSDLAPVQITCLSATWCLTFDGLGRVLSYDGEQWSRPFQLEPRSGGGIITAISCASTEFCAAVDSNGDASFDAGTSWSEFSPVSDSTGLAALSCPSVGVCFAVDGETDEVYRYANGHWMISGRLNLLTPQGGSEPNTLDAISCGDPNFCVALDDFGEAFTYDGKWSSAPHDYDNVQLGNTALSCTAALRCVIVDDINDVVVVDHGVWSAPRNVDSSNGTLVDVSCAPGGRCVAVDDRGGYLIGTRSDVT